METSVMDAQEKARLQPVLNVKLNGWKDCMSNENTNQPSAEAIRAAEEKQMRKPRIITNVPQETIDRFWSYVKKTDGCWEWQRAIWDGYGIFGLRRRTIRAHRFSWTITNGAIPDGMLVCHRCDNRKCVRPDHLFLGTDKDNHRDCRGKGRVSPLFNTGYGSRGDRSGRARLTSEKVLYLWRVEGKERNCASLARKLGVPPDAVRNVYKGKTWRHLMPPEKALRGVGR